MPFDKIYKIVDRFGAIFIRVIKLLQKGTDILCLNKKVTSLNSTGRFELTGSGFKIDFSSDYIEIVIPNNNSLLTE